MNLYNLVKHVYVFEGIFEVGNSDELTRERRMKTYLIQDRLPLLGVGDGRQLHVPHLLHLLVHVDLLLQLADLGAQQPHRVLPVVLTGKGGGTRGVDRRDPVLQLCLARCLTMGGKKILRKRATMASKGN